MITFRQQAVVCLLSAALAPLVARAQVPTLINYQGRLLDGTNLVNATVNMSLTLYNSPSGGGFQYVDTGSVVVVDGLYSTFLGDGTALGTLTNALAQTNAYLEVTVNGTPMSPRERLASVAYAVRSSRAETCPGALPWQVVSGASQQAQPNTGYLLTNDALVTVTLPTAPTPGDVVRISSIGAGGWKLAQNASQVAVTKNISGNFGGIWTAHESNRNWRAVASSSDGSKLVAVVSTGQIYTSTDSGLNWSAQESARNWISTASSSDGSKLVAVVNGGQIYTSTDSGLNWTARDINRSWTSVASSSDGSKLVAVVLGGQIYTSTDSGTNWTARNSNHSWVSVASSSDGSKLVAAASGDQIYTSTDSGTNWTARDSGRFWISVASSSDGSKLVALVNFGQIYTSVDSGVNWTANEFSRDWLSVTSSSDGSKLVAVVEGGQIYTSADSGVTWIARDGDRSWNSVASSSDGSKLVAVVNGGQIYASASTTTSGTAGYLLGDSHSAIELQYVGNGQFIPISYAGSLLAY